jgi:tRNA A-37 threonylcarbamoyl transferase component Bud32
LSTGFSQFDIPLSQLHCPSMHEVKDTARALVRIGYDGRVHKTFRGHLARERFENECQVLRHLEARGCEFVPRLLETEPETLKIVTTNCGKMVEHLPVERMREIYAELERYGVRHQDAYMRNITYRAGDGRFCVIDFEFATLLDDPTHHSPPAPPPDSQ